MKGGGLWPRLTCFRERSLIGPLWARDARLGLVAGHPGVARATPTASSLHQVPGRSGCAENLDTRRESEEGGVSLPQLFPAPIPLAAPPTGSP